MEFIKIGTIINTFGIKGELKIKSLTDFPEIRFKEKQLIYVYYKKDYLPFTIKRSRQHKGFILLTLLDNEDINLVEKYKNCDIFVDQEHIHSLNEGEYYYFQLRGCEVYYNNQSIGKVTSVEEGYQTVLRIKMPEKELLLPYVKRFIKDIDVQEKRIDIDVIEGML